MTTCWTIRPALLGLAQFDEMWAGASAPAFFTSYSEQGQFGKRRLGPLE